MSEDLSKLQEEEIALLDEHSELETNVNELTEMELALVAELEQNQNNEKCLQQQIDTWNTTNKTTEMELRNTQFEMSQVKAGSEYWNNIQSVRKKECQTIRRQLREAESELESKRSELETLRKDLDQLLVAKAESTVSVMRWRKRTLS